MTDVDVIGIVYERAPGMVKKAAELLQLALQGMVTPYDLRIADATGLPAIYLMEHGFQRMGLGASVSLELRSRAWSEPFEPPSSPHWCDTVAAAADYVRGGLFVASSVQVSAMSVPAPEAVCLLLKASEFSRIVLATEDYLRDALRTERFGERYLELAGMMG